jgi:hypothetical protein
MNDKGKQDLSYGSECVLNNGLTFVLITDLSYDATGILVQNSGKQKITL